MKSTGVEIMANSSRVQRLDIVMDTYQSNSIKNATREARGTGPVHVFEENDKLPKDFISFFKNDQNKTKLNEIIQKHAMDSLFRRWNGEVMITNKKNTGTSSRNDGMQNNMVWIDEGRQSQSGAHLRHA